MPFPESPAGSSDKSTVSDLRRRCPMRACSVGGAAVVGWVMERCSFRHADPSRGRDCQRLDEFPARCRHFSLACCTCKARENASRPSIIITIICKQETRPGASLCLLFRQISRSTYLPSTQPHPPQGPPHTFGHRKKASSQSPVPSHPEPNTLSFHRLEI
ncbi:hypothetical protein GQ53DRAFT_138972 [Thozetella sp. PMI_491]|nr:hypothetical protein GQ53DRAFT_138972 [Thozetella sp. PMI_491]